MARPTWATVSVFANKDTVQLIVPCANKDSFLKQGLSFGVVNAQVPQGLPSALQEVFATMMCLLRPMGWARRAMALVGATAPVSVERMQMALRPARREHVVQLIWKLAVFVQLTNFTS